MNDSTPAPVGAIAHYTLLERMEPAGPGDLYRARDTRLGRTVAVRVLPHAFAPDAAAVRRVLEQARALQSVSHPNITTVFDVGMHEGRVYLVFEFLKGQSLRAEMGGRAMNVRRAVELAIQIADAVAEAHAAGFVHGGLSPESIVVTAKGHAKLPASELAAHGGFEEAADGPRLRDYISPEEAQGQPSDDRSDTYSVGAVLFEMLTNRRPHLRGAAAPSGANANVPAELDRIVLRAIAPNPDSRYQSAAALAGELRATLPVLDAQNVPSDDEPEVLPPNGSRSTWLVAIAVIVAGAIAWWLTRS
jgi:eukaryotic-like serine/threonine-protein kinase